MRRIASLLTFYNVTKDKAKLESYLDEEFAIFLDVLVRLLLLHLLLSFDRNVDVDA